jgi:hypothetical protein
MASSDMHMQAYNQIYKAIPIQARTGPEASRRLRLLEYNNNNNNNIY